MLIVPCWEETMETKAGRGIIEPIDKLVKTVDELIKKSDDPIEVANLRVYRRTLEVFKQTTISPENRKSIVEYLEFKTGEAQSTSYKNMILRRLITAATQLGDKDFKTAKTEEIKEILVRINEGSKTPKGNSTVGSRSPKSQRFNRAIIKGFYEYILTEAKADRLFEKIPEPKVEFSPDPQNRLTWDEVVEIGKATEDLGYEALTHMLFDSGLRINEACRLKIGDVETVGDTTVVRVRKSKTPSGVRAVALIKSQKIILDYINLHHPRRADKNAYLFYTSKQDWLSPDTARDIVKKAGKKSGVNKPLNPHNYRKSFGTFTAKYFGGSIAEKALGHVVNSQALRSYVTLSDDDVTAVRTGKDKVEKDNKPTTIACQVCGHINPSTMDYCLVCRRPLNGQVDYSKVNDMLAADALITEEATKLGLTKQQVYRNLVLLSDALEKRRPIEMKVPTTG